MKERILRSRFVRWFFDLKLIKKLQEHRFFGKFVNYEVIAYIIAGIATTIVSYGVYFLVRAFLKEDYGVAVAQVVSFIAAVLFAYVVNKIFVFDSPSWKSKTVVREFLPFVAARIFSFVLDTAFVYLTVVVFRWNEPLMKIVSNVIVLILNYIASKFLVFRKKTPETGNEPSPGSDDKEKEEKHS